MVGQSQTQAINMISFYLNMSNIIILPTKKTIIILVFCTQIKQQNKTGSQEKF